MIIEAVKLFEKGFYSQGFAFEDLPEDRKCPKYRQGKDRFNKA